PELAARALADVEAAVDAFHRDEPLRPGLPVERLRALVPPGAPARLVDALLEGARAAGRLDVREGAVHRPDFAPRLSERQRALRERIVEALAAAGLQPPPVADLPNGLGTEPDTWPVLKLLEREGVVVPLADDLYAHRDALAGAARAVVEALGGREGLGPTDFREALPVSRRHLMPILALFDRTGVTLRDGEGRSVADALPPEWR
ncbi:MAG: hypothetical protein D6701_10080, partial [Gemmatimonadetes bacterium]